MARRACCEAIAPMLCDANPTFHSDIAVAATAPVRFPKPWRASEELKDADAIGPGQPTDRVRAAEVICR